MESLWQAFMNEFGQHLKGWKLVHVLELYTIFSHPAPSLSARISTTYSDLPRLMKRLEDPYSSSELIIDTPEMKTITYPDYLQKLENDRIEENNEFCKK